jgi:hypothetical protein
MLTHRRFRNIFGLFLCVMIAQKAFALGTETRGNEALSEFNYTLWKGIMPVINDKARVYQQWVNGNELFFYEGTTKDVNAALAHFAKIEVETHFVVLCPGPMKAKTFKNDEIPCDWELHVIAGLARSRASDKSDDLYWHKNPVLTIFISDKIDLEKLEIPKGITLRSLPGKTPDAIKNRDLAKKIAAFVAAKE